jgi:SAM-dependent methyltransferase
VVGGAVVVSARGEFETTQDRHFADADEAHFRWATEDPAFAPVEDELLGPCLDGLAFPCLEVGCGEGTNLARLVRRGRPIGIDRYVEKARFAAHALPAARLACADAGALPFRDGTFRSVVVRDVFHHVPDAGRAAAEAVRVLAPGGTLAVLEPNGRNPLIAVQARLVAAEARLREFTPASVRALLAGLPLDDVRVSMAQALPLRRLLLHHRFGVPALGRIRPAAALLAASERVAARLVPRSRWSYTTIRARRR